MVAILNLELSFFELSVFELSVFEQGNQDAEHKKCGMEDEKEECGKSRLCRIDVVDMLTEHSCTSEKGKQKREDRTDAHGSFYHGRDVHRSTNPSDESACESKECLDPNPEHSEGLNSLMYRLTDRAGRHRSFAKHHSKRSPATGDENDQAESNDCTSVCSFEIGFF